MRTILALLLSTSLASAADLALKAPRYTSTPCTIAECSGFFAGFNVAGVGSNLDILGSGINNSVFAGGGMIGVNGGYQLWNGQFFAAAEVMGDVDFNTSGVSVGKQDKFFAAGLVKLGMGLGNLLGTGDPTRPGPAAPSQGPVLLIPGTALLSPYVTVGGAWRNRGTGWVTGAGTEFILTQGWNLDVSYMHINYNAGVTDTTIVPGAIVQQNSTENLVEIALKRKF